ncbi:hypothetical protein B0H10DRAFT_126391 [Mycena sp. CBHHK59/15]|nr:hypothetical protein B0H10DRAFT_126391 [Mycena sp. CBHHK59/15]
MLCSTLRLFCNTSKRHSVAHQTRLVPSISPSPECRYVDKKQEVDLDEECDQTIMTRKTCTCKISRLTLPWKLVFESAYLRRQSYA